ncbi:Glycine-zipper containing OmpA-like membrane domain-containing protein [Trichlorobacter thiogenes]|uniref:Glycine-zipper containing OmpA-like membrane domain-containing protein n=1 Tax=Trichlorobacter thiogenes TaxID=115783 RepID=A0A1T4QXC4_9BACT|nr:YMGG-like glycine zipper-containing protein [Trichlorobacter thiogenes]SKA08410.1 Glycine-zipper containing OmpA-like membrane domain-containing protein [Trichlorobacter thiogenes]
MKQVLFIIVLFSLFVTTGCTTLPTGPSVHVLPGSDKSFEQFQIDDAACRVWAGQGIGLTPDEIRNQSTISGAGVGALFGAVGGALIGSASGNAGVGAAIGAGGGLLIGSAVGADKGRVYGYEAQHRYDSYYLQCMYAKGNQVPGAVAPQPYQRYNYAPPEDARPAPPGMPPPGR